MALSLEETTPLYLMYTNGEKLKDIASFAQCSISHIKRSFAHHGLKPKRTGRPPSLTLEKTLSLHREYLEGKSFSSLSKAHGVGQHAILGSFRRNNLATRPSDNDSRCVNEFCFDKLTRQSLYWIGFLMADGWVNCRDVVGVGAHTKDIQQIENFKSFTEGNQGVLLHPTRNFCSFQFRSTHTASTLDGYGVTKKKSLTANPSDAIVDSADFWRGMVDGDGTLFKSSRPSKSPRLMLTLAGSVNCVEKFRQFCFKRVGESRVRPSKKGNIFTVTFTGSYAKGVASLLYANAPDNQRLERKHQIYLDSFL